MSSHFNNHDILSPAAGSVPMAIRGSDNYASLAPPPLPPPRLPPIDSPVDPEVHMKERMRERYLRKEDVGSPDSALGMSGSSGRPSWLSRARNEYDEGYQSPDSYSSHRFVCAGISQLKGRALSNMIASRSSNFSPSFGQTMNRFRPDSMDNGMLSKLNSRPAQRPSGLSASSLGAFPAPRAHHAQLTNLSLPHRNKQPFLEASFTRSPVPMSATSPGNIPFSHRVPGPMDYRSPVSVADSMEYENSPLPRTRRLHSTHSVADSEISVAVHSYDGRDDDEGFPMEETRGMRSLNIEDQWRERESYQPGQKRRASSPPSEDNPMASGMMRGRDGPGASRGSPTPRLLSIPHGTSMGGISPVSRNGNYSSNLNPSGITFGRRSPTSLSPSGLSPTDQMNGGSLGPFGTSLSMAQASGPPRSAIAIGMGRSTAGAAQHPVMAREVMVSPRKLAEIPKNPTTNALGTKLRGPYMCECCPKKPKKFDSEEELRWGYFLSF